MSNRLAGLLITATSACLFLDGKQYAIGNDHPNFQKILDALAEKNYDAIPTLADIPTSVRKWLGNRDGFTLTDGLIALDGEPFTAEVTDKVLNMIDAGNDADPLYKFLRKVRNNPSRVAQTELLLFCVANNFMIHEDGDILAYKSVRPDYTDIHSGKISNRVGETISLPRHTVDDRRDHTCSTGLHFASHTYATSWHSRPDARLMIMKINPADVVSIPNDYNNQKGRCCKYLVYSEIPHTTKLPDQEVYYPDDFVYYAGKEEDDLGYPSQAVATFRSVMEATHRKREKELTNCFDYMTDLRRKCRVMARKEIDLLDGIENNLLDADSFWNVVDLIAELETEIRQIFESYGFYYEEDDEFNSVVSLLTPEEFDQITAYITER